jgi:lipopolysaccharide biosynthesis regulator YciM
MGNAKEALNYFQAGFETADQDQNQTYKHRFQALKGKYIAPETFEEAYQNAISYFHQQARWEFVMEYSEELGMHYGETKKYKEAFHYCDLAIFAKNKMEEERAIAYE